METVKLDIGMSGTTRNGAYWDDLRTVQFQGEQIAEVYSTDHAGNRGVTETLYLTKSGRMVVYVKDWSHWQGENTSYSLKEISAEDLDIDGRFERLGRKAGKTRTLTLDDVLEDR